MLPGRIQKVDVGLAVFGPVVADSESVGLEGKPDTEQCPLAKWSVCDDAEFLPGLPDLELDDIERFGRSGSGDGPRYGAEASLIVELGAELLGEQVCPGYDRSVESGHLVLISWWCSDHG